MTPEGKATLTGRPVLDPGLAVLARFPETWKGTESSTFASYEKLGLSRVVAANTSNPSTQEAGRAL